MRFLYNTPGRRLASAALLAAILLVSPAARPEEPAVFAITNAHVIPVAAAPIDKGTVVLRNGIIEAVGANIEVPPDARIIDGAGLTVYPGLINALSDIGLEEPHAAAAPRGGGAAPARAAPAQQAEQSTQSAEERQGLTPYRQAYELISPASRKIEAARSAGITTTLVSPRQGYFTGQSSLINLSGGTIGHMTVKTPVAYHINLGGRTGSRREFPSSLMGAFAFVRQTLLDAQHYGLAWSIYNSQPGAVRPEYSRPLEALQPLVLHKLPAVLPGNTPAEIQRSVDLADAFKLQLILSGGAEAGKIAGLLKEKDIPVLLSVKFPERERDSDPEVKEELNQLRRRVEAPDNAAALAKAGVRFAFQSEDMASPADFIRNVRRTVAAGLDKDAALRALTLTPAEIFGVSGRLGSIEKNKTANLILTTGDLFDPKTQVKLVFIDGERYEPAEPEPQRSEGEGDGPGRGPQGEAASILNVSGTWSLEVTTPNGKRDVSVVLRQSGSSLSGSVTSEMGTTTITEGSVSGGTVTFKISPDIPGQGIMNVTFSGTVRGNSISGTADIGPMGKIDFTGSKGPGEQ